MLVLDAKLYINNYECIEEVTNVLNIDFMLIDTKQGFSRLERQCQDGMVSYPRTMSEIFGILNKWSIKGFPDNRIDFLIKQLSIKTLGIIFSFSKT